MCACNFFAKLLICPWQAAHFHLPSRWGTWWRPMRWRYFTRDIHTWCYAVAENNALVENLTLARAQARFDRFRKAYLSWKAEATYSNLWYASMITKKVELNFCEKVAGVRMCLPWRPQRTRLRGPAVSSVGDSHGRCPSNILWSSVIEKSFGQYAFF